MYREREIDIDRERYEENTDFLSIKGASTGRLSSVFRGSWREQQLDSTMRYFSVTPQSVIYVAGVLLCSCLYFTFVAGLKEAKWF